MKNPLRSPPWDRSRVTSMSSMRPSACMRPNMPTNSLKTSTARSSRPRTGDPNPMNTARSGIPTPSCGWSPEPLRTPASRQGPTGHACHAHDVRGGWPVMSIHLRELLMRELPALRYEPIDKRIRGTLGGETVVDSTRALLVWEPRRVVPDYAFPEEDVHGELVPAGTADDPAGHGVEAMGA